LAVTFDWQLAVAELQRGLSLAVARRGVAAGAVVEVGPGDWLISEAGIEHADSGVVLERRQVPPSYKMHRSPGGGAWRPDPPPWADPGEWHMVTAAVVEHLPTSWIHLAPETSERVRIADLVEGSATSSEDSPRAER
jgi:hypothetical protein